MKKKLIKFIQYFDFFGAKFSLKYKNYEYFKSFLGGIIYSFGKVRNSRKNRKLN